MRHPLSSFSAATRTVAAVGSGRRLARFIIAGVLAIAVSSPAGAWAKIKVAAVGASTTKGSGSTAGNAFPDQLQRLLGAEYEVHNYGVSSATAMKSGEVSYWKTKEFQAATALGPNAVIVWLGGADTKPENWDGGKDVAFVPDMVALIRHFQALPTKPVVVVMLSVALKDVSGVRKALVAGEVNPRQKLAAMMTGSLIVDLPTAVGGRAEFFPDGIHPNNAGTLAIATAAKPVLLQALQGGQVSDGGVADGGAEAGAGGAGGTGGAASTGGAGGGGNVATGGTSGAAGAAAGAGGSTTGGTAGTAGMTGTGGAPLGTNPGNNVNGGSGGTSSRTGGSGGSAPAPSAPASSGGCTVGGTSSTSPLLAWALLAGLAIAIRRRRR